MLPVTISGKTGDVEGHPFRGNQYAEGQGEPAQELSRSDRAKLHYSPATAKKQRLAEKQEKILADHLKGTQTGDNAPTDVHVGKTAVEVKTIVNGKNPKITMHPESLRRKLKFEKSSGMKLATVAIDIRGGKPVYYVKKGVGSFRLGSMKKVSGLEELGKELRAM